VVVPPAGPPRHDAGVGQVTRAQRAVGGDAGQDVPSTGVVGLDPGEPLLLPVPEGSQAGPRGHLRPVEREVLAGADHPVELDQPAVREGQPKVLRVVGIAHPAPQHEIRVGGDGGCLVDLEERQRPHDVEQVGVPRVVEELRAHGDATGVLPGQLVRPHGSCLPADDDSNGASGFRAG